ncbi:MAG: hypothetical protein RPS47_18040 [Colwellia sp.]|jgi:hypothetical protein
MFKTFSKIALLIGCGFSLSSVASNVYELDQVNSFSTNIYPGLNLNNSTGTKIFTSTRGNGNTEIVIDKVEVSFPNANDLVITGFKFNGAEYVAVADDAWVFSQVVASLNISPNAEERSFVSIRLAVLESESKINTTSQSVNSLPILVDVDGLLVDVTPKILADSVTFDHEGKAATLSLYRDINTNQGGAIFDMSLSWLGHGVAAVSFPAPIPVGEVNQYSSLGLSVDTNGPEAMIELSFLNSQSYKETIVFPASEFILRSGL